MDVVFLDANVLFSAAYMEESGLLRLWKLRNAELVSSAYAVEEARRNLDTPARKKRLETLLRDVTIHQNLESGIKLPPNIHLPDNDIPILAAAIGCDASHLLTGDLKAFGKYYGKSALGVRILKPSAYIAGK